MVQVPGRGSTTCPRKERDPAASMGMSFYGWFTVEVKNKTGWVAIRFSVQTPARLADTLFRVLGPGQHQSSVARESVAERYVTTGPRSSRGNPTQCREPETLGRLGGWQDRMHLSALIPGDDPCESPPRSFWPSPSS